MPTDKKAITTDYYRQNYYLYLEAFLFCTFRLMYRCLHIVSLILFWVVTTPEELLGARALSAASCTIESAALEQNGNSKTASRKNAASQFGVHQEGESSAELLNRVPAPPAFSDTDNDQHLQIAIEAIARRFVSDCLSLSKTVRCSQAASSILFPFHSFL